MTESVTDVTNQYLQGLVDSKEPISIYLMNGIRLQGVLRDFDDLSVVLHPAEGRSTKGGSSDSPQLVNRSAISTYQP